MINSGLFGGEHTQRDCLSESMNMSIKEEKQTMDDENVDGCVEELWGFSERRQYCYMIPIQPEAHTKRYFTKKCHNLLTLMLLETCMLSVEHKSRFFLTVFSDRKGEKDIKA